MNNKKDIVKDPHNTAKAVATIFGDADDSDLEVPEDLDDSAILDDKYLKINSSHKIMGQEEELDSYIKRT